MIRTIFSKQYLCILFSLFMFCSCDDSFLDVEPETEITSSSFFKSPRDLQLYSNMFYAYLPMPVDDEGSDNVIKKDITSGGMYRMMQGLVTPENAGQWYGYWQRMRDINFYVENCHKVSGPQAEVDHYKGVGRFFRAWYYYTLVKQYSDLPWYSRSLQTNDLELLYKKQDPRTLVVDSIFQDFEYAVNTLLPHKDGYISKTTLTKWAGLAWTARFALHEGTMRKYHPELGLTDDYKRFLQLAIDASQEIIASKHFDLFKENGKEERSKAYEALFNNTDLLNNPEMIMIRDFDKDMGILHDIKSVFNEGIGLSRDLLEDYLVKDVDGNWIPFTKLANYKELSYAELFRDRDPRLAQTFMYPGFKMPGYTKNAYPDLNLGGYLQIKFYPTTADQIALGSTSYIDRVVFRYGEILLINAEAKAELGILTQEDLDNTIGLLRERVGMPKPSLVDWLNDIDPVLARKYPNVSGEQKGAILEIRRERRVELACEGHRLDDLMRWKVGELAAKTPCGLYVAKLGPLDISGDGIPEFYISHNGEGLDEVKEQYPDAEIISYNLDNTLFQLSEGNSGYIQLKEQVGKFHFEDKYYYYPISVQDMSVNPNLYQNPLWK